MRARFDRDPDRARGPGGRGSRLGAGSDARADRDAGPHGHANADSDAHAGGDRGGRAQGEAAQAEGRAPRLCRLPARRPDRQLRPLAPGAQADAAVGHRRLRCRLPGLPRPPCAPRSRITTRSAASRRSRADPGAHHPGADRHARAAAPDRHAGAAAWTTAGSTSTTTTTRAAPRRPRRTTTRRRRRSRTSRRSSRPPTPAPVATPPPAAEPQLAVVKPSSDANLTVPALLLALALARPGAARRLRARRPPRPFRRLRPRLARGVLPRHRRVGRFRRLAASRTLVKLDHVQLAAPPGCEPEARRFFGELLGLAEVPKPAALAGRGGVWFERLHVGVDDSFAPARKAHPALRVDQRRARRAGRAPRCTPAPR